MAYGGRDGVANLHLIQSAIGRPYIGYHRPIANKAAALLHGVVGNHGFIDANKRTAWLLVELLIDRSGYILDITDDEPVDDLVVNVARSHINLDDLIGWFAACIVRP